MRLLSLVPLLCPFLTQTFLINRDINENKDEDKLIETEGEGRYFHLLAPYRDVDFGANFNKLKGPGDTAYFIVRDTIAFWAINFLWMGIHSLIWDGRVSNLQDIATSLLSPGFPSELTARIEDPADSRLSLSSLQELSAVKLWNFFADPNPSTRNLYLNIGWALSQQLLWILPTYFGLLNDPDSRSEERIDPLAINFSSADPVALWNRLLSPQGVLTNIGINTLAYSGKLIFWWIMSVLPDAPANSVITGRNNREDKSLWEDVADTFIKDVERNIKLMIGRLEERGITDQL